MSLCALLHMLMADCAQGGQALEELRVQIHRTTAHPVDTAASTPHAPSTPPPPPARRSRPVRVWRKLRKTVFCSPTAGSTAHAGPTGPVVPRGHSGGDMEDHATGESNIEPSVEEWEYRMARTAEEAAKLRELRLKFADQQRDGWPDDAVCLRFLRARDYDLEQAAAGLAKHIEWRREVNAQSGAACEVCRCNPGTHPWRQIAFDRADRPLIYYCFSQAKQPVRYEPATVNEHLIHVMENAKRSMGNNHPLMTLTWLVDFSGFRFSDVTLVFKLLKPASELFGNNYPCHLSSFIAINPPRFFYYSWKTMQQFLDPATARKVIFLRGDEVDKDLLRRLDHETASWLLEEIKLNGLSPVPPSQLTFWKRPAATPAAGAARPHDPRGSPRYLRFCKEGSHGHQCHPNFEVDGGYLPELGTDVPVCAPCTRPGRYWTSVELALLMVCVVLPLLVLAGAVVALGVLLCNDGGGSLIIAAMIAM